MVGVETEPELGPGFGGCRVWAPLRQLTDISPENRGKWDRVKRAWQRGMDQHRSTVLNSGGAEMNSRLMGSVGRLTGPSLCSARAQGSSHTEV